jgi:hypothetical protein
VLLTPPATKDLVDAAFLVIEILSEDDSMSRTMEKLDDEDCTTPFSGSTHGRLTTGDRPSALPLRHAPAAAARTELATFAREGDQSIQHAGSAPRAGETRGQTAPPQDVTKLLLDRLSRPFAPHSMSGRRSNQG